MKLLYRCCAGMDEYNVSQSWAQALHHPAQAHGLLYPSRLDPVRQSVALFRDQDWKLTN